MSALLPLGPDVEMSIITEILFHRVVCNLWQSNSYVLDEFLHLKFTKYMCMYMYTYEQHVLVLPINLEAYARNDFPFAIYIVCDVVFAILPFVFNLLFVESIQITERGGGESFITELKQFYILFTF